MGPRPCAVLLVVPRGVLLGRAAWCARGRRPAREPSARRVASKPGQAPPPPTGTAARPSGALPTGGACVAWTSPAWPRRRPRPPQPGPAAAHRHRGQAVLPVPLHPGVSTLIVEPSINFACNSLTALSNHEYRLLELQRFQTLFKLLSIELHATFLRPGPVATFGLRGQALRLEVRSVPPVSATPGCSRGGCMKEISPLRSTVWSCGVPL